MDTKLIKFIILVSIASVFVWILGEVLIGLVIELDMTISIIWAVIVVIAALALTIYKGLKNDDDDRKW